MNVKIKEIAKHRNGVGGAPFYVVLFSDDEAGKNMMGIVFDEKNHVAVLDVDMLADGNIAFGDNSWRGDRYEPYLREAIAERNEEAYS